MGKKVRECLCLRCGKEFTTTHPQKKYCSYDCLWKAWSAKERNKYNVKICKFCGHSFKGLANDIFCSEKCENKYKALMKQKKKCATCLYSITLGNEIICDYINIAGHSRLSIGEARTPCRLYIERGRISDK